MDFNRAFDEASNFEFDKFRFDEPNYSMLMFDEESYLEHLRVQSAGLAYYGTLAKSASRTLEDAERRYKIRYNELFAECSDILARTGKKNMLKDIEALVQCKYEDELNKWDEQLKSLRSQKDAAEVFYEAWKAKGFTLNAMTNMITAGLLTPRTTISENDVSNSKRMSIREARETLRRNN